MPCGIHLKATMQDFSYHVQVRVSQCGFNCRKQLIVSFNMNLLAGGTQLPPVLPLIHFRHNVEAYKHQRQRQHQHQQFIILGTKLPVSLRIHQHNVKQKKHAHAQAGVPIGRFHKNLNSGSRRKQALTRLGQKFCNKWRGKALTAAL